VRVVAIGVVVGIAATAIAILIPWLPDQASEEGERIDFVFWLVTGICIVIFSVVASVSIYSVVKFRARPDDDSDGPPIHGHTGLEITWTAIPAAIVTVIAVVSAVALAENASLDSNRLKVDVTARQFAWTFKYPQYGGIESGTLRLPRDRQVELRLRSLDVIHSFSVPEFRQKQDAVPGQLTKLPITPTRNGNFPVICYELCGLGHALMRTRAIVMDKADFEQWARSQQTGGAGAAAG
jgi:cytochrome c oxidase subunit 2